MFAKRYLISLLFLLSISFAYAQETSYLQFNDADNLGGETKEISKGKLTYVYSSAAFVRVQLNAEFQKLPSLFYCRAYFKEKDPSKLKRSTLDAPIYLLPGQEFLIDVLDIQTDTLIKTYVLQRPKLIPVAEFYDKEKPNQLLYSTATNEKIGEFECKPGTALQLGVKERSDFKNLSFEYTLLNLKTKQQQHGVGMRGLAELKIKANTDYELRINYKVQTESVGITYIRVKPYWYQSVITYFLFLGLVVFALIRLTVLLTKRIRSSQKQQQKLEQAALRLQSLLNPHFTFNALSSIQGLMNSDRIDEANQYLEEFSTLLRKTLNKSQQVFNSLDQELEMMWLYLKLEAFRFNFTWTIEVDQHISTSITEIPTLLLQPLIENAIKHGLAPLGERGQLNIICKTAEKKDTFVIIVKDNGQWLAQKDKPGYGLSLTQQRITTINQMKKEQSITLHFTKQEGTEAIFTFHHWI